MRIAVATFAGRALTNRNVMSGFILLLTVEILLATLGLVLPIKPLVCGWLLAFAIWSLVPIGSLAWLMIHCLTGGEWGQVAAPVLRAAAAMMPLVALAFLPVLIALHLVYPWAADPSTIPYDVARWYLNEPSFAIRAVVALTGWSLLGFVFAAGAGSRILAGLGLTFFGLTISLVSVDWYLSLEPGYVATAFAAMIAIQQLLAALAVVAVLGVAISDGKVTGDLGCLLIATLLGVVYLEFMTFVVAWYGDQSEKAEWFLERASFGWIAVLSIALIFGALLPFAMLLVKSIRCSRNGLRVAGAFILFGATLHLVWLLLPALDISAGTVAVGCVVLAILVVISLMIGTPLGVLLEEDGHAR